MQGDFQKVLIKFYQAITKNKPFSDFLAHSLESYLSNLQMQDEKNSQKERNLEQIKSFKSVNSNLSTDGQIKVKKVFHTTRIESAILFVYMLHMVKSKRMGQLNIILKMVSQRFKQYDRLINNEEKKRFGLKFNKLNQQLLFLSYRVESGCKIDWLFYQAFMDFEEETMLFTQLISSSGEILQSQQKISSNQYSSFLIALQIKCYLFDQQKQTTKQLGSGSINVFIGKKGDTYFIESQKQPQRMQLLGRRDSKQNQRKQEGEGKGIKQLKKYSSVKFKEQFLAQVSKIKQQYQVNTAKIASLFNFKDSVNDEQKMGDESRQE